MKKLFLIFGLFFWITSCDDAIVVDAPDMTEFTADVDYCGSYLVYQLTESKTVALILNLDSRDLPAQEQNKNIPITEGMLTYREFDGPIDESNYFCQDIPPLEPSVINQWISQASGFININTTEVLDEETEEITGYLHLITLNAVVWSDTSENSPGIDVTQESYQFGDGLTLPAD